MAAESLQDLFVEELRDMYDGEKRLTKALPKMAKAAQSLELRTAINAHLAETRQQVTRLERALKMMNEPVRGKTCHGIKGIVEEGANAIEELEEGALLDAAIIAGSQKVEHYEISSYGTLAYFAELLGQGGVKALLGETLEEEKAADKTLNALATSKVNREALLQPTENDAQTKSGRSPQRSRNGGRSKNGGRSRARR
jgi:ferritin-like metal-binding protein YciE